MYDTELIIGKLMRWERFTKRYSLPEYNEIPDFGLYMDQVLQIMNQYLSPLRSADPGAEQEDNTVTASAINNYVRMKVMPAPEKKKYYRIHLMYLIIICTLKLSISISDIQKLLPADCTEEEMIKLYTDYMRCFKATAFFFATEVRGETQRILSAGKKLLEEAGDDEEKKAAGQTEFNQAVQKLIFSSCAIASLSQLFTTKLINLDNMPFTEEAIKEREA